MLSRQAPREKSAPPTAWASSGPRCVSEASMVRTVSMSLRPKTPQIPHMSALQRYVGAGSNPFVHRGNGMGGPDRYRPVQDALLDRARARIDDVLGYRDRFEAALGLAHAHVFEDQHMAIRTGHGPGIAEQPVAKERGIARIVLQGGEEARHRYRLTDMRIAQASPPAVAADQGPGAAASRLGVDADEEVDYVHGEDAPDDDAEEVGVELEGALQRTRQRAARVEVVEEPGMGQREEDEVAAERDAQDGAEERPGLDGHREGARADELHQAHGQPIAGAARMKEQDASQHHHLAQDTQANMSGDEGEAADDQERTQESGGGKEHEQGGHHLGRPGELIQRPDDPVAGRHRGIAAPPVSPLRIGQAEFHSEVPRIARGELVNASGEHDQRVVDLEHEEGETMRRGRHARRELEEEDGGGEPVSHETGSTHAAGDAAPAHAHEEVATQEEVPQRGPPASPAHD